MRYFFNLGKGDKDCGKIPQLSSNTTVEFKQRVLWLLEDILVPNLWMFLGICNQIRTFFYIGSWLSNKKNQVIPYGLTYDPLCYKIQEILNSCRFITIDKYKCLSCTLSCLCNIMYYLI